MVVLKLIFSIPIIFLLPGYMFSYALFSERGSLDPLERLFVASASSLAITSLVGIALLKINLKLNSTNIIVSLSAITLLFGLAAIYRLRKKLINIFHEKISVKMYRVEIDTLWVSLIFIFVVSLLVASWIIPNHSFRLSEFYVSPDWFDHKYANNSIPISISKVPVVIHNLEGVETSYRIEAYLDGIQIWESDRTMVEDNATYKFIIPLADYDAFVPHLLTINLLKNSPQVLASTLRLHIGQSDSLISK